MPFKAPKFWQTSSHPFAFLLWPFSLLYGAAAAYRMRNAVPFFADVPCLCVGNYSFGGEGKTPTALAFAKAAQQKGLAPGFLSRGYGGIKQHPHLVDQKEDTAHSVGDEALLLARLAPTVVAGKWRLEGAKLLQKTGCNFIIMDDGFQSRRLFPDFALIVQQENLYREKRFVFPAGPLRAPLEIQKFYTNFVLLMKKKQNLPSSPLNLSPSLRQAYGFLRPFIAQGSSLAGRKILAFCGLARPEKFFSSVQDLGGQVMKCCAFEDHHFFSKKELASLAEEAQQKGLHVVTTAKDYMRFRHAKDLPIYLQQNLTILDVELLCSPKELPFFLIEQTLHSFAKRRQG